MTKTHERQFFDQQATIYDTEIFNAVSEVGVERIRRRAASIAEAAGLHLGRPLLVLEVGCGTGEYTREFASSSTSLTMVACDLSVEMVKQARRKAPRSLFVVADGEALPFRCGAFDAVVGNAILHHLPDLDKALAGIMSVTKPFARVVFREPNLLSPGKFFAFAIPIRKLFTPHRWSPLERAFSRRSIIRRLGDAGFGWITVEYAGLVVPRCPARLAQVLYRLEGTVAKIPVLRALLGSLKIVAQ